ncbi:MAG: hypothetical protein FWF36_04020 [Propionibacteriaceae bacterium]|nr:hypothetical protein [Propionibacteriaceae bacterium]
MLKFAKRLLLIVGAIIVIGAAVLVVYHFWLSSISLNAMIQAALTGKSLGASYYNPTRNGILIAVAAALAGGIVLGIGIGVPSETFKQRQAEVAKKAAADTPAAP